MRSNIDQNSTLWQLAMFCFLTGFTSAPTFLACYLWCGFQSKLQCMISSHRLAC